MWTKRSGHAPKRIDVFFKKNLKSLVFTCLYKKSWEEKQFTFDLLLLLLPFFPLNYNNYGPGTCDRGEPTVSYR